MSNSESAEIIREFLEESREFVESLNAQIQTLEQALSEGNQDNNETINAIFRGFHSIKGSANYLKLDKLARLTHEAESLLDGLRKGKLTLRVNQVEVLFACECLMEKLLDEVENGHHEEDLAAETETLIVRLQSLDKDHKRNHSLSLAATPDLDLAKQSRDLLAQFQQYSEIGGKLGFEPNFTPLIEALSYLGFNEWVLACRKLNWLSKNICRMGSPSSQIIRELTLGLLEMLVSHAGANKTLPSHLDETQKQLDKLLLQELALARSDSSKPLLGETLLDLGIIQEDQLNKALKLQGSPLGTILCEMNALSETDLDMALRLQQKRSPVKEEAIPYKSGSIRVNVDKLNSLCNLVEELVLAETLLCHDWQQVTGQSDDLSPSARMLNRISRDLQQIARQLRMIPLDATLQKLSRMARDLAGKLDKKIKVEISGGDTEIDKNVVEMLGNPLAHMVRNALDHGLESPEKRRAAGKSEVGTLSLTACHEGSNIVVRIADDGRGLDAAQILAKARERELIGAIQPRTQEEIFDLIWLPGFSTAATVTELSGRGVGMDVVRKEIEALHGQVKIDSQTGKGTTFTLTIPLSLSIIDGMLVRAGDNVFTLPLLDTRQTIGSTDLPVCFPPGDLPRVRIQDRLLPIFSLHHFFSCTKTYRKDPVYVVVEAGQTACCLSVDEVVGMRRTVIQSVPRFLGRPRAISGFSILGDGTITYILDTLQLGKLIETIDISDDQIATNS